MGCSWEHKLNWSDAGLECANVEQKLWAMTLILALLKTQLDFSLGGPEGDGTLETKGLNSSQINISHSPMQVSENSFSPDIARSPLPPAAGGDMESSPLIT